MKKIELQAKIELWEREVKALRSIKVSCQTCEYYHLSGSRPHCGKFDAQPPAEVLPVGCEEWSYDDIPF
jgi:hypothetical protein